MNDSSFFGDENRHIESRPPLGEDLLPPVEKPSARFIVQLFVVPMLIVAVVVVGWVAFRGLVRRTTLDPNKLVEGIESGPSVARWQRANDLANILQDKRYTSFRRDRTSAAQLARILDREMNPPEDGRTEEERAAFPYFLAMALGQFDVPDGLDTLLKAADKASDKLVRYAALEAIAARASNLQQLDPPEQLVHPELERTLLRLASDEDPKLRRRSVFALGKIASPAAIERLEVMTDDPDSDTRYNAAVALAHHGNAKAVETLAEMLDLEDLAAVREEENELNQQLKRTVLIGSAIGATHALAQQNPKADLSPVIQALDRLAGADAATLRNAHIEPRVVKDAKRSLAMLKAEE
jgi:HEAT repeat protein